jgi:hypothetical protein
VEDNGHGIPKKILDKLNSIGGSYGKVGGAGPGLKHARETLVKVGGTLNLTSTVGIGTRVTLRLPVAPIPKWYIDRLDLSDAEKIVVLEDDPSMLLLRKQRLGDFQVTYLTDLDQFDIEKCPKEMSRYFFDDEIGESPINGFDLIETHDLKGRAVLVTSYFDDSRIQRKVEESGTFMIPKFLASQIDILQF